MGEAWLPASFALSLVGEPDKKQEDPHKVDLSTRTIMLNAHGIFYNGSHFLMVYGGEILKDIS